MRRPRGGEWLKAEMELLKAEGVTDLVTLLTPLEETDLGLLLEPQYCDELGIRFYRHPVPDREVPPQPAFDQFIDSLLPRLQQGGFVAIHCRVGIGRSSVAAAALLCRLGVSARDAIILISRARGFAVPDTDDQLDFILDFDQGLQRS